MICLTNRQARQFMLLKQGLLGGHKFTGKQGAAEFVRQAGCIQFDPVDVCGGGQIDRAVYYYQTSCKWNER